MNPQQREGQLKVFYVGNALNNTPTPASAHVGLLQFRSRTRATLADSVAVSKLDVSLKTPKGHYLNNFSFQFLVFLTFQNKGDSRRSSVFLFVIAQNFIQCGL